MNARQWTVKTKLVWAFGSLTVVFLLVAILAITQLSKSNADFESYIQGVSSRMQVAADVRSDALRRAVAARNVVLSTTLEEIQTEKQAVMQAHGDLTKHLTDLKDVTRDAGKETEHGRQLVADIERVESLYAPVAKRIVGMALEGKKDEAIASS